MKKIVFSNSRFLLHSLTVILLLFISFFCAMAIIKYGGNFHFFLLIFLSVIIAFLGAIYPLLFIVLLYKKDKNTVLFYDKNTGDIHYTNAESIHFNINEISKIEECLPFLKTTLTYYTILRLTTGKRIIISCFVPIRKMLSHSTAKINVRHIYWIKDLYTKT